MGSCLKFNFAVFLECSFILLRYCCGQRGQLTLGGCPPRAGLALRALHRLTHWP